MAESSDHRAGDLADDLRDQFERVLGMQAQPDESDIWALSRGYRSDLRHLDLACDHLVP